MVPSSTIARVFSEISFTKPETRMKSDVVTLSAEYIRLFIQEAVARANTQREAEERATEVNDIDHAAVDNDKIDPSDQFGEIEDFDEYDELDRGSGISTQLPPPTDANDTLTTRHLAAVSGLLVMDF